MKPRAVSLALAIALATWISAAGGAHADEVEAPPVEIPLEAAIENGNAQNLEFPQENVGAAFELAEKDWKGRTSWRYGTDRFFPLTRELRRSERVPDPVRYGLYVLTVPWDIAYTPIAAIAGLYGR